MIEVKKNIIFSKVYHTVTNRITEMNYKVSGTNLTNKKDTTGIITSQKLNPAYEP